MQIYVKHVTLKLRFLKLNFNGNTGPEITKIASYCTPDTYCNFELYR